MTGPEHDRFCEYHGETMYGTRPCTCDYLARVRADEREQAVERVKDLQGVIWEGRIGRVLSVPTEDTVVAAIRGGSHEPA